MTTEIEIDWTVTIELDGVLIIENDVRVLALLDDDEQVTVKHLDIIKYGNTIKLANGCYHKPVVGLITFTGSDKPWLAALGKEAARTLESDDRFIAAVVDDYETRVLSYAADSRADYLNDMARGA